VPPINLGNLPVWMTDLMSAANLILGLALFALSIRVIRCGNGESRIIWSALALVGVALAGAYLFILTFDRAEYDYLAFGSIVIRPITLFFLGSVVALALKTSGKKCQPNK
jgi:hypothetical protein